MPSAAIHLPTPESPARSSGLFSSPERRTLVLSLALVLLTVLVYWGIGNNAFINFDDNQYITDNFQVKSGLSWDTVKWAFVTYDAANWHPLTWLSHALDSELFGLNPVGHHYVSLLLHAANVVLLFLLLQWLTGYTGRGLTVAALFAVHPINVESVAWIAERKNVLCMFFFLLTLLAYAFYVRRPSVGRYLAVALLFAMALMSKPMAITLPFVLLLLDYWPIGRLRSREDGASRDDIGAIGTNFAVGRRSVGWLIIEKVPLLAMSVASAV